MTAKRQQLEAKLKEEQLLTKEIAKWMILLYRSRHLIDADRKGIMAALRGTEPIDWDRLDYAFSWFLTFLQDRFGAQYEKITPLTPLQQRVGEASI